MVNLRDGAITALESGDITAFLGSTSNEYGLDLVAGNLWFLVNSGLYEKALLVAYTGTRTNWSHIPTSALKFLFSVADRSKLLAAGDPLPDRESFVAYRGVSGYGRSRRICGFSWTASMERAKWFAERFKHLGDPAVYSVTFIKDNILAYINKREAGEFILLPDDLRPTKEKWFEEK